MSTSAGTPTRPHRPTPADRVVEDLVDSGLVHAERRDEAREVVARALGTSGATTNARGRLVEVAGYLGGSLVIAALGLFLADNWADLGDSGQVSVLVVITLLLGVAGGVVAAIGHGGYDAIRAGRDEARRRLSSALLVGTAFAGACTVGRVADIAEVGGQDYSSWPWLLAGLTMVGLGVAAYRLAPSAAVVVGLAGGALTALFAAVDVVDARNEEVTTGIFLLLLALVWLAATELGAFREDATARSLGVAMALLGAQFPLFDDPRALAYVLTAVVAVGGFGMYLQRTAWPYLVGGVVAVTLVVPEAIIDGTDGSLGAGGAVLVAGLTLLGASAAGFRVRQEARED